MLTSVFGNSCVDVRGSASTPLSGHLVVAAGKVVLRIAVEGLRPQGHFMCRDCISCVALSESGNYAAAAVHEAGGGAHVFHLEGGDTATQQYLECPQVAGGVVHRMAFSPNAAYLVCVSGEEATTHVVVWKWRTATIVAERRSPHGITGIAFLDRSNSAFAAVGREMTVWNIKAMTKMLEVKTVATKWDRPFVGLHCTAEGIVGFMQSGRLCLVNPNSKKKCDKWLDTKIETGMFMAVGCGMIAVGGSSGTVRIFNQATWSFICTLPKPQGDNVSCINGHFTAGGRPRLLVVHSDRSIVSHTVAANPPPSRALRSHDGCVCGVASLGAYTVTIGHDGHLKVLTAQYDVIQDVAMAAALTAVAVMRKDRVSWLCCGDRLGNVHVFRHTAEGNAMNKVAECVAHELEITSVAFFESENAAVGIATAAADGFVYRHRLDNESGLLVTVDCTRDPEGDRVPPSVTTTATGDLVSCGPGGRLTVWSGDRLPSVRPLAAPISPIRVMCCCGDNVVVAGAGPKVSVLDAATGGLVSTLTLRRGRLVTAMAAHHGRRLVAVAANEVVHLVSVKEPHAPSVMYQLLSHSDTVTALCFQSGGRLVSVGGDGLVCWWALVAMDGARMSQSRAFTSTLLRRATTTAPGLLDVPERYRAGDLDRGNTPKRSPSPTGPSGVLMRSSLVEASVTGRWADPALKYFVGMRGKYPLVASMNREEASPGDMDAVVVGNATDSDDDAHTVKVAAARAVPPMHRDPYVTGPMDPSLTAMVFQRAAPVPTKCPSPKMNTRRDRDAESSDGDEDPTASMVHRQLDAERNAVDLDAVARDSATPPPPPVARLMDSPSTTARRSIDASPATSAVEDLRRSLYLARSSLLHALEVYGRIGAMQDPMASTEAQNDFKVFADDIVNELRAVSNPKIELPPTPSSMVDLSLILSRLEKLEQGQCIITDMLRKPQQ